MFVFKSASEPVQTVDIIDWTDFGTPKPDYYQKLKAVELDLVVNDIRDIFDDDIIINGKPSDWFLNDFGGFG